MRSKTIKKNHLKKKNRRRPYLNEIKMGQEYVKFKIGE